MSSNSADLIQRAAEFIKQARHAVVFTGAGISTPSGIPDFRSERTGLWQRDDPMQVASLTAFQRTPQKFYDWLSPLAKKMWEAKPNPAHIALAELEKGGYIKAVITQNIDGLHHKAGSQQVIEVHGSMNTCSCPACKHSYPSAEFLPAILEGRLPACPRCGRVVKPDIVLYEEMLPVEDWALAEWHASTCDLMLVVGSSLETMPAAGLPYEALRNHAHLIINTLASTPLDGQADVLLRADTLQVLPQIAEEVLKD